MALETTFQIPEVPVPRNEDIKRKVIPLKTNHIPKPVKRGDAKNSYFFNPWIF